MNDKNKNLLNSTLSLGNQEAEQFIEILDLPDEEFDATYPMFKDKIKEIYQSEFFQKQTRERMQILPQFDLEETRKAVGAMLEDIDNDETLSANKKEMLHLMFDSTLEVVENLITSGRTTIPVKITKLNPEAIIPQYAHPTDAGADICAIEEIAIEVGETKAIPTGLAVAIPSGYMIQVYPRSGLSAKTGLRIANSIGIIDTDYRGELKVLITNTGSTKYVIDKGMKIAQLIIAAVPMIKWEEVNSVEELGKTERGAGGFGSTGVSAKAE